ncbi:hypothetical protein [Nocardioides sp. GXQ0305]|uniref:hypothetical protein n=1 Tax=Nocardioides sp. GXQ0305 TaxID=3423912 RepID=UPI003D7E4A93
MSPTVYLHIGAPKTGTTYLQDMLTRNASALADHDVHFPGRSALVSPGLFQFRAALDLLGQDWGGAPGHAEGSWEALVRRVRRRTGTVVVSHEILAPAPPDQVARAMADLGPDVHVVYTARDLGRQVPAAWQESIKQGRRWRYASFVRRMERGRTWFSRAFDLPTVLGRWGAHVPPEHVHLITLPPSGHSRPGDDLWHRFCRVVGIDPAWAPEQSTRSNVSLGVAEAAVLRRLNKQLDRRNRRVAAYDGLVRSMLAEDVLVQGESPRITLPPDAYEWVDRTTSTWLEWIEQAGIDVVGDVEELRPARPETPWRDPDQVSARKRSRVALNALAAMTVEAAKRPDPDQTLRGRVRQGAVRLKPW